MYHRFMARRKQASLGCPKCLPRCDVCGHKLAAVALPREKRVTGPYQTRAQLVDAILDLHKAGYLGNSIAVQMGISAPTVSRIINGDGKQGG